MVTIYRIEQDGDNGLVRLRASSAYDCHNLLKAVYGNFGGGECPVDKLFDSIVETHEYISMSLNDYGHESSGVAGVDISFKLLNEDYSSLDSLDILEKIVSFFTDAIEETTVVRMIEMEQ